MFKVPAAVAFACGAAVHVHRQGGTTSAGRVMMKRVAALPGCGPSSSEVTSSMVCGSGKAPGCDVFAPL